MAARDRSGSPVMRLTQQQKIIHKDLKKKGIPALILWLDKIKEEALTFVGRDQVKSPFNTSSLKINAPTGKYAVILKWCVENIPEYDFSGIPPSSDYKISARAIKALEVSGAPSAAAATSRHDTIIEDWLKNPSRDENGKTIEVSLHQTSAYFKLYTRSFNYLNILHNPSNKPLTKEIYQKIQERLPKLHTYDFKIHDSNVDRYTTYTYDHLMMKILGSHKLSENDADDKFFITEYNIFEEIYIQIEILLKVAKHKNETIKVLMPIIKIIGIMYEYTYRIMEYTIRILRFNKDLLAIKSANFNMELTYKNIEIDKIKIKLYFYIYDKRLPRITYKSLVSSNLPYIFSLQPEKLNDIYEGDIRGIKEIIFNKTDHNDVINYIKTAIFDISELYEEAKINVEEYLPVSEDPIASPPVYPSRPVQRSDIAKYVMLKNKIQLTKAEIEESTGKNRTDLESELKEYNKIMSANYTLPECEAELKEHDKKMKLYKLDVQKYERELKKYKNDVLGKQRKFLKNSHSPTRVLPFTPIEKRAHKSASPAKNSTSSLPSKKSGSREISKCVNDSDPITQEAFEDMSDKKLKNLTKITTTITTSNNEKKEFVTCYDTVSLYNYILECYNKSTVAYNIGMGRDVVLTNDDKNQVKKKIRAFTLNKTLPPISVKDSDEGDPSIPTNDKKVFGRLIDLYDIQYITNRNSTVIGYTAIQLWIKIGGIDFPIFQEAAMKIPMLIGDSVRDEDEDIPMIINIYDELLERKESGNLFTINYFPYRKRREYILKVPDTTEMWTPNASEDTLIDARERFYRKLTLM
jgi:hypothetical protein